MFSEEIFFFLIVFSFFPPPVQPIFRISCNAKHHKHLTLFAVAPLPRHLPALLKLPHAFTHFSASLFGNSCFSLFIIKKKTQAKGGEAAAVKCDVKSSAQTKAAFDFAKATYGPVYLCCANAGTAEIMKELHDCTEEEIDHIFVRRTSMLPLALNILAFSALLLPTTWFLTLFVHACTYARRTYVRTYVYYFSFFDSDSKAVNQKAPVMTFLNAYPHFKENGGGVYIGTNHYPTGIQLTRGS